MQSASSRIWTGVAVSISYDDNHNTTGIDTYLIEHNWHFFDNPFELPYWSYDIRQELVDKPSIISYFPFYFLPNFGPSSGEDILQK